MQFIKYFEEFLLYREIRALSERENFSYVSPKAVLSGLDRLGRSRSFTNRSSGMTQICVQQYEDVLVEIWERAAEQARMNRFTRNQWLQVMAICNSLLCSLIPPTAKDISVRYIENIDEMRAA